MIGGVADTHTALWYLLKHPRLSSEALAFMERAGQRGEGIAVSSISLVELAYLVEKERLPREAYAQLTDALADPAAILEEAPVHQPIVDAMRRIERDQIPDMPDRIIAATALYLNVPVITRDGKIRASNLKTVW